MSLILCLMLSLQSFGGEFKQVKLSARNSNPVRPTTWGDCRLKTLLTQLPFRNHTKQIRIQRLSGEQFQCDKKLRLPTFECPLLGSSQYEVHSLGRHFSLCLLVQFSKKSFHYKLFSEHFLATKNCRIYESLLLRYLRNLRIPKCSSYRMKKGIRMKLAFEFLFLTKFEVWKFKINFLLILTSPISMILLICQSKHVRFCELWIVTWLPSSSDFPTIVGNIFPTGQVTFESAVSRVTPDFGLLARLKPTIVSTMNAARLLVNFWSL